MKIKHLLSLVFVAVPFMASAQITIDETNFPDENFRNYLLEQWYGEDGVITDEEIKGITFINVSSNNIGSLKGIEYFTALTYLDCNGNQLTALDVSECTALIYLSCNDNQLTALDASSNTALTELRCNDNQLTVLDVSGCKALTILSCNFNQLTSLDASGCKALTYLDCYGNQLTALEVSGCKALTSLFCYDNQLTALDTSGCTALTYLQCKDNQLISLYVSGCTALAELWCEYNQLTALDVSECTALTKLQCDGNLLTSLDVFSNTALTELGCNYNQLTSLDVSGCKALTNLGCDDNQLTSLDVSGCTALAELWCDFNQLTALDVSGCKALTQLRCSDNQLTSLDVSNNIELTYLRCSKNQIKGITMDTFINSLPINTSDGRCQLYIYSDGYEDNICTHSQAAAIKDKGWPLPYYDYDLNTWSDYEGCDDPTTDIVSVGADGLATYCPAFDMDFTNATKIAAYKSTISGNNVLLERIYAVAAGEGVLLRSLNGGEATEELPIKATEKSENNAFAGVLEAKTLKETDGNVTNFVLSKKDGEVGFFKANDTRISAWKAYLPVENYTADMAAKGLNIIFDDATGINDVTTQPSADDDAIYTLSGVRVTNPTKGIYLKNGKKIVVK